LQSIPGKWTGLQPALKGVRKILQQRKVVSIGEYHQIHRVLPSVKQPSLLAEIKNMLLGILAIVTFIIGFILTLGQ
jgi:hypothetical protein